MKIMTTTITENDLIQSIADAVQFISFYHPDDYIEHLARAYEREQNPAARDAIEQILTNSRMCAEGHSPICQDTGVVNVFLKKIGRASCRERVCQYGSIWVVAVPLKTKKH